MKIKTKIFIHTEDIYTYLTKQCKNRNSTEMLCLISNLESNIDTILLMRESLPNLKFKGYSS